MLHAGRAMLVSPWQRVIDSRLTPMVLMAVFVALIVATITRFGTWIDESASLCILVPNGYLDILHKVQYDAHPPLWYLQLKLWLQIFGNNELSARIQSALYMVAALVVWFRFVCSRFTRASAVLSLTLLILNPMILHHAIEGRMYALGTLLTVCSVVALSSQHRWHWYLYWLCTVLMLYTQYFLSFVIAGQFVYLLFRRAQLRLSIRWILGFGLLVILPIFAWIPHAFHVAGVTVSTGIWIAPISPATPLTYVLTTFLHHRDRELQGIRVFPALLYLFVWTTALGHASRQRGLLMPMLWCVVGVPLVCLLILSCKPLVPVFDPRYVIFGLPALTTLLALGALRLTRWRSLAITVLISGQLWGLYSVYARGFPDNRVGYSIDNLARDISERVDGEQPSIVTNYSFAFFNVRATLPDSLSVRLLVTNNIADDRMPDVIYNDKPEWVLKSLDDVHTKYVWLIEQAHQPSLAVPASWTLQTSHAHGYASYRLFKIDHRPDAN